MKITVKRVKQTTLTIDVDKIASISGINNGTNSFILFTTDGIEHEIVASEYNNLLAVIGTAGGSGGGGSSEYQGMPVIETTERVITLEPNNYYIFGECATLDISIQEPVTNGRLNEYRFEFLSGTTPTVLTLPSTVTPSSLNIQANTKYVISIKNNVLTEMGVQYDSSNTLLINMLNRTLNTLNIPEGATMIPQYMFQSNTSLINVTLPSTLRFISNYAFQNCTALTNIVIPEGVEQLSTYSFQGCISLVSVTLPSTLKVLQSYVFNGCTVLASINLPNSLVTIDTNVFQNCKALSNLNFPEGITTIPSSCCNGCSRLAQVSLPSTLLTIASYGFQSCISLSHIVIPNGVLSIGQQAFDGCSVLKEIEMYDSITTIHATYTFRNINSGCRIRIYGTTNIIPFLNGAPAAVKFYVDDSMVQAYKTNSAWSARASYIYSLNDYTP